MRLLLPLLLLPSSLGASQPAGLQLISTSATEVVFSFEPPRRQVSDIATDGNSFFQFVYDGGECTGAPGEPCLPSTAVLVAVPPGAQIQVEVEPEAAEIFAGTRLLPVPRLTVVGGFTQKIYEVNESIYAEAEPWPAELVRVAEVGRFRDQRVARLVLTPARYVPAERRLEVYGRLLVRVRFVGGTGETAMTAVAPVRQDEAWYAENVLNYEQGRQWRGEQIRQRGPRKRTRLSDVWAKLFVSEEGIYRVTGRDLADRGIQISGIDPRTLRLYNNGGRELPRSLSAPRPDRLIENPILVVDGGDGRFDEDDYFLFYGKGVSGFSFNPERREYEHYIHHYVDENVYWLTWGGQQEGKRIRLVQGPQETGRVIDVVRDRVFVENELRTVFRSGYDWYGWLFTASDPSSTSRTYTLDLPAAVGSEAGTLRVRFYAGPRSLHKFVVKVNGTPVLEPEFRNANASAWMAREFEAINVTGLVSGTNRVTFEYSADSPTAQVYLDWFTLEYSRQLSLGEGELFFSTPADNGMVTFRVEAGTSATTVWEVSRPEAIRQLSAVVSANGLTFSDTLRTDLPRRYAVVEPQRFKAVKRVELDVASDLRNPDRGAEFIIITYDDFYPEAMRLKSLRENWNLNDRLETEVVRISDVFDEFSWGLYDATAVRDFLKFAYDNWNPRPRYVLLFGDGDYDPKNRLNRSDRNWIPTFQNRADHLLTTLTSDQWFTFVSGDDQIMDLAIGRLSVRSLEEARTVVDKIIAYETQPEWGDWRQVVTLVGDDLLGPGGRETSETMHINDSEGIAQRYIPGSFDVEKIYLTEYPAVRSASVSGVRKPLAAARLLDRINRGSLIVNFIGHGNPHVWTHELVLSHFRDMDQIDNGGRLAFFIAATCDFARFDDPNEESMAEDLLRAPGRGAIGVLSSARLVYASPNADFNRRFLSSLFAPLNVGRVNRLGDAFVSAANTAAFRANSLKFHLLADPTLRLRAPAPWVRITQITPDSLRALSRVRVQGQVMLANEVQEDFNGSLLLKVFDSAKEVNWKSPQNGYLLRYWLPGGTVFRGPVPVRGGRFAAEFIVPKDLSYGGRKGRISAYAWSSERDAAGSRGNLAVGGTETAFRDDEGPEVRLYFEGRPDFVSGDIVGAPPVLVAEIADSVSGVNITGAVGHGITLIVDGDRASRIDLTPYFIYDEGSFTRGRIRYPLPDLEPGEHQIELKAWDNSNNSRSQAIQFIVQSADEVVVRDVWNYPNPFSTNTAFTFVTSHEGRVRIQIYTLAGRLVQTLESSARPGFNTIEWNGLDMDGDRLANGVYLYRVTVTPTNGSATGVAETIGRLVVQR
jgi:hypothetical protein